MITMFRVSRTVAPSMTDRHCRLKLFSALQLMQDCSEMWKESEPAFRDYMKEHGVAQLLAFRQLDICRVPSLHEVLSCTTTVYDLRGSTGFRNTVITDEGGQVCYASWCMGAFVNRETGGLVRIPQEIADSLEMSPRYGMNYRSRKIILPDVPPVTLPAVHVQRNDIDYNQHVNNAHYVRMALEFLPVGFEPASLRVEYKAPAYLGTCLQPRLYDAGNTLYLVLQAGHRTCCVMEVTNKSASSGSNWYAW